MTTPHKNDVPHDFDFFFHHWVVHNHKLTKRLQNCDEWIDFDARACCVPALGGLGNTDQLIAEDGTPIGMSLRFFNREKQQWSIFWVSFHDGLMQPPVHGGFNDCIGIFEGDDVWEGTPVRVRFVWSDVDKPMPKWEQYFSPDNGKTWEKNWVMTFERLEE